MIGTEINVAYSRKKNDPEEVYHPDPDCQHRERIINNGNALWHKVSTFLVGEETTVDGGRKLRKCKDCAWTLQDETQTLNPSSK